MSQSKKPMDVANTEHSQHLTAKSRLEKGEGWEWRANKNSQYSSFWVFKNCASTALLCEEKPVRGEHIGKKCVPIMLKRVETNISVT